MRPVPGPLPVPGQARPAGASIDPATRGPAVDTALRTTLPPVFAAGNLVHAAETADIAAQEPRRRDKEVGKSAPGAFLGAPDRGTGRQVRRDGRLPGSPAWAAGPSRGSRRGARC